ncbi:MAG: hypothetical protein RML84_09205 [Anaerolineae bacterium]|nr:hypothetical protein [Anaerolineae bacterium]
MEIDTTWLAVPTLIALSALSERLLERAGWFQRQHSDTKRLIAILAALALGVAMAQLERMAGASEELSLTYAVISALVQQLVHAFAKSA